ncbi:MAG: 4'-phosphopantetheinyl transferase superfamily protein [Candidatus Krumholzibacteriia bacterium]
MQGLGTDLVEIARVAALLRRHGPRFRARICGPAERARVGRGGAADEAAALAGSWAAKEAFLKALGAAAAGVPLAAIEVAAGADGAPALRLRGAAAAAVAAIGGRSVHLALARAGDRIAALVTIG